MFWHIAEILESLVWDYVVPVPIGGIILTPIAAQGECFAEDCGTDWAIKNPGHWRVGCGLVGKAYISFAYYVCNQ